MSVIASAASGSRFAAWAGATGPTSSGTGTTSTVGTVTLAPGLDGYQSLRLTDGHILVTGVPDFTAEDSTVEMWVRLTPGSTGRTLFARVNGSTEVSAAVGADGRPTVVVASTAGPYRVTLRGPVRIDDGQWHQIAVVIDRGWFSIVDVALVVDGASVVSGQIRPGLFGAAPQLGMTTALQIGARDGASRLMGDVLVAAVRPQALSTSALQARWDARPAGGRSGTGWGIVIG